MTPSQSVLDNLELFIALSLVRTTVTSFLLGFVVAMLVFDLRGRR